MKHVMDRRALVKSAAGIWIAGSVTVSGFAGAYAARPKRYILISRQHDDSAGIFAEEVGAFIAQRDPDWMARLQALSLATDHDAVVSLLRTHGPQTEVVEWPIIVAIPEDHAGGDEIELWSSDWLRQVKDRIADACYPVSGGWWSVDGDWNPTAAKVRKHLFESPNHTDGQFTQEWLDMLSRSELQSIHSDHHREMVGQGTVHWQHVNGECPVGE